MHKDIGTFLMGAGIYRVDYLPIAAIGFDKISGLLTEIIDSLDLAGNGNNAITRSVLFGQTNFFRPNDRTDVFGAIGLGRLLIGGQKRFARLQVYIGKGRIGTAKGTGNDV